MHIGTVVCNWLRVTKIVLFYIWYWKLICVAGFKLLNLSLLVVEVKVIEEILHFVQDLVICDFGILSVQDVNFAVEIETVCCIIIVLKNCFAFHKSFNISYNA